MAGSSSNTMLIVMAMFAVALACAFVYGHMHPELVDSVKNWFVNVVKIPNV